MIYGLILSLELVKLEILKSYTKANLASNFIKLSRFQCYSNIICLKKNSGIFLHIDNWWLLIYDSRFDDSEKITLDLIYHF